MLLLRAVYRLQVSFIKTSNSTKDGTTRDKKGAARTTLHSIKFDLNVGISTCICGGDRKTIKMNK